MSIGDFLLRISLIFTSVCYIHRAGYYIVKNSKYYLVTWFLNFPKHKITAVRLSIMSFSTLKQSLILIIAFFPVNPTGGSLHLDKVSSIKTK